MTRAAHSLVVKLAVLSADGVTTICNRLQKWSPATMANFCFGVIPPRAMFGRSLL